MRREEIFFELSRIISLLPIDDDDVFVFFFQWKTVNLNNPDDCFDKFKSNRNLGLVLLAAIILGTGFKERQAYQYEIAP